MILRWEGIEPTQGSHVDGFNRLQAGECAYSLVVGKGGCVAAGAIIAEHKREPLFP